MQTYKDKDINKKNVMVICYVIKHILPLYTCKPMKTNMLLSYICIYISIVILRHIHVDLERYVSVTCYISIDI